MTTSQERIGARSRSRPTQRAGEGLRFARFMMVLSSLAPLFLLWAIRGIDLFPREYVAPACILMALGPTAFLLCRWRKAEKERDRQPLTIGIPEDHKGYVLTYLFAILLPFYRDAIDDYWELAAMIAALLIVVFLFWHLNFHYINLFFAVRGYKVIMVHPEATDGAYARRSSFAVITRRDNLMPGEQIVAYRLSNTVYVEVNP